jgi:hypothetical protein
MSFFLVPAGIDPKTRASYENTNLLMKCPCLDSIFIDSRNMVHICDGMTLLADFL